LIGASPTLTLTSAPSTIARNLAMSDENTTDTHDLEYVDASQVALILTVDLDGNVKMQGVAPPEYIVSTLRHLADEMEVRGWE
jgi:hypothetical protein